MRIIIDQYHFYQILTKFKFMYPRMISFIEEYGLLYHAQHGFRKSHSTQRAILDIIDAIQNNMDKRFFSCGIFID